VSDLDYFLIACDLRHEDISRILAYTREGTTLAPLMDRNANPDYRGSRLIPRPDSA
jgi:hypothetical protein